MKWHFLPLAAIAVRGFGQSSILSEQSVHAIEGARIEIGDGTVIEHGNVVIRRGLIVAIGVGVPIPAGAEVLDGKGLTVYPGFIDGFTSKGLKLPDTHPDADAPPDFATFAPAQMRVANRKGIRPELLASQYLALSEDVRSPYLKAGFTTAMVSPGDGSLSGIGTLVNLGGRPTRDSVIVSETGSQVSLGTVGGSQAPGQAVVYPGTILGTIAQVRQTLLDAQWHATLEQAFTAGGTQRPPVDPSLEALQPLLQRRLPAIFDAPTHAWIERSLDVGDEFGLRPIVLGGEEAWKSLDRLKKLQTPLVLAIDFGREPSPKKPPEPVSKAPETKPAETKPVEKGEPEPYTSAKEDAEPKVRLDERERLFMQRVDNSILIDRAGMKFALSTKGCKDLGEFMTNLRRLVQEGLPKATILRSLTLEPAKIYGVERQLGSIAAGKIANLTVMTGDFLDEKTKVKMLYIDGRKIDPNRAATPAPTHPTPGGEN